MRQRYAIIVKKESNEIKNMGWSKELMCTSAAFTSVTMKKSGLNAYSTNCEKGIKPTRR